MIMQTRSVQGFTLIELVIALSVIGILLAVAVPAYREQVVATRRAEGKSLITEVAARLERCYTRFNAYDNDACEAVLGVTSEGGWYTVPVAGAGADQSTVAAQSYTLRAIPQRAQAEDDSRCGTLTLTNTGVRSQSLTPPSGYDCW
jgi:type IV pilus assembly protein PilE